MIFLDNNFKTDNNNYNGKETEHLKIFSDLKF